MSKIGKQIINIPAGLIASVGAEKINFSNQNGSIDVPVLSGVIPKLENNILSFEISANDKQSRSNWGTTRALSANAVIGLTNGFAKELKIEGVGYKAVIEGDKIILNVGYSHQVKFDLPKGIKVLIEKNILKISGIDKRLVGEIAAQIRAIRKPEPYKGKGIMYTDEIIRRKAGKKVAGSGDGKK